MRKFITLIAFAGIAITADSQDFDQVVKSYPDEDYVILRNKTDYKIRMENGVPEITSTDLEEWMYLTENGAVRLKSGWIFHSGFHELKEYDAYTVTSSGKKVRATDFKTTSNKSSGIFYDDSKVTNFNYPNLSKGAMTHLEYNAIHHNAYLLSPHYFSSGIPTLLNELKITFPKSVKLRYVVKGIDKDKVIFKEESKRNETVWTFTAKDLKPNSRYPDAPENAWWATHVVFFIEQVKQPDGNWTNFLSAPADLYTLYTSYVKNINKSPSSELQRITDSLVAGKRNEKEKAVAVYSWVQQNIKYVAFEDGMEGFVPREANLVCSRRFGDCKDMASIIYSMLRHAGLKSYYTWIGTRALPYTYEETPTPIVDNHMICAVLINNEYIFLDGTDITGVFGKPAEAIQGKQALVGIDDKNFKIIPVPVLKSEENQLVDSTIIRFTQTGISGHISMRMKGYYATNLYGNLNYVQEKEKEKFIRERLNRGSNKFVISGFAINSSKALPNESDIAADFEIPGYGKSIGDEKYINLNLVKHYEHEEIDYPKRKIPIEFNFASQRKHVMVLEIPEGYKVDYLPESKSFKNDVWGFTMTYEQKENKVILTKEFSNPHIMITPEQFKDYNTVLEHLFPLYKESVSLVKK
ncbi:DUF3857 domain-containing protein [Pollutibacter soli]|uniref:DUF3857 domain-containing protein n=1 Tax=Pollutibacter soli TaxID=3034157 RepID=UPI003013F178